MRKEIEKIVYGKRDRFDLYKRKIEYKFFSIWRNLHKCDFSDKENYVVLYPAFNDQEKLNEFLNRAIWSYPVNSPIKIIYSSSVILDAQDLPFQHSYIKDYIHSNMASIKKVEEYELNHLLKKAKAILVWDKSKRYKMASLSEGARSYIIDPWYYSLEECNNMKFGLYNMLSQDQKQEFYDRSIKNFRTFKKINAGKDYGYIFVTGPSYSTYKDLLYEKKSLKIICNTIVKDTDFLEYIGGPDIICFADPAFHFSTNNYAFEFRELVMSCVEKYGSYIAVPQAVVPLMSYHYPKIRNKIIGFRFTPDFVIPCESNLSVKPTGSVITFLMIPIAASLVSKIGIIGADGRQKGENYFWKHNDKVQLGDLMESVYETHASFFRDRIYANHYERHCEEVRQIVQLAEQKGVKVVAKTPSFVPCLSERYEK